MSFLELKSVSKKNGESIAVDAVSFVQKPFEKLAIAGETGSGKTSLLKMIGGLMQVDGGEILFENQKVAGPLDQLIPGHKDIAYLSQHFELRNNYWVDELLDMANKLQAKEAEKIFTVCEIEHLLKRRTNELSGGEKQRIVLAMQLVKKPKLLLLDEPFSNLDAIHERTMKQVIQNLSEQFSISCIMVSHDGTDVLSWADTVYVMKTGKIVQQGTPRQIYNEPVDEYCAGLFGEYNLIDPALGEALSREAGFSYNGNKILMRPEHFTITSIPEAAITGTVTAVLYYGNFYMLEINAENSHTIKVRINSPGFRSGDTIGLRFSRNISFSH